MAAHGIITAIMTLRYKNTPLDIAEYGYLVTRGLPGYRTQRYYYYSGYVTWLALWAYSFYVTVASLQSIFVACVLVVLLSLQFRHFSFFDSYLRQHFLNASRSTTTKEVELHLDERGLTDTENGIVSFAPWGSVDNAEIRGDLLLIRLSSGQYAVIPRATLEPPNITLEQVLNEVKSHLSKPMA